MYEVRKRKEQNTPRLPPGDAGSVRSSSIGRLFALLVVVAVFLNGTVIYMYRSKSRKAVGTPGAFGAKKYQVPRLPPRHSDASVHARVDELQKAALLLDARAAAIAPPGNATALSNRLSWRELLLNVSDAYGAAIGIGLEDVLHMALAELEPSPSHTTYRLVLGDTARAHVPAGIHTRSEIRAHAMYAEDRGQKCPRKVICASGSRTWGTCQGGWHGTACVSRSWQRASARQQPFFGTPRTGIFDCWELGVRGA